MKSGGQDPKELYDMACSLMEAAKAMKEMSYAMGYEEDSDLEKMSEEADEEREEDYENGDEPFVDHAKMGEKTYGERKVEEEEAEDAEEKMSKKLPIGKRALIISLKKKFG